MSATNVAATRALVARAEAIGGPVRITSLERSVASNLAAGGSKSSQHLDGSAADVVPVSGKGRAWFDAVRAALPPTDYGQIIYYPSDGHTHLSLPNRASGKRGEQMVANTGAGYTILAAAIGGGSETPEGPEGAATWGKRITAVGGILFVASLLRSTR